MRVLLCGNSQMATRCETSGRKEVSYELLLRDYLERVGIEVVSSLNSGKLMRSAPEFPKFDGFDIVILAFGHNELSPRPLSNWQIRVLERLPRQFQNAVRIVVHKFRVPILKFRKMIRIDTFKISMKEFHSDLALIVSESKAKIVFIEVPLIPEYQNSSLNYGVNRFISKFNSQLGALQSKRLCIARINIVLESQRDLAFLRNEVHFSTIGHELIFKVIRDHMADMINEKMESHS